MVRALALLSVFGSLAACGPQEPRCIEHDTSAAERMFAACVSTSAGWNAYRSARDCRAEVERLSCRRREAR
ncbi:hypothetical protein [Methylobacterium sp. CCH5-D2]|uniref:hypothetical protein n=1 Tax=Methylobacterium sp. CCH5-D2 TaxID=1768765 RepID=UPI0008368541|nr:hypothetical protein [Methylobacterium sp. CCH5-D2]